MSAQETSLVEMVGALTAEVRALRDEVRGIAVKRIEPQAIYSVEEACVLVKMSARTLRGQLRARIITGTRNGRYAPWRIRGAELLKLGGKIAA